MVENKNWPLGWLGWYFSKARKDRLTDQIKNAEQVFLDNCGGTPPPAHRAPYDVISHLPLDNTIMDRLPLSLGLNVIGRKYDGEGAPLNLFPSDHTVSRFQLVITVYPPLNHSCRVTIRDLESTNGTHLNGQSIGLEEKQLKVGDIVVVGLEGSWLEIIEVEPEP